MMRSMYAGVSGLRTHQLRMDVIGNNIANVNTVGYKKSRAIFKDAFYQAIRGGSAPTGARGGTNPQAIGLGVQLSSVDVIATPGSAQTTGKNTDLAIDGNGYFILESGGERYYTRAGAFDFDVLGNYVASGGLHVMGYMPSKDDSGNWITDSSGKRKIDITTGLVPIDISALQSTEPKATTLIRFSGNFDSTLEPEYVWDETSSSFVDNPDGADSKITSKEFYDTLGNKRVQYFKFEKVMERDNVDIGNGETMNGSIWRVRASSDPDCPNPTASDSKSEDYYLFFDEKGKLIRAKHDNGTTGASSSDWQEPDVTAMTFAATDDPSSQSITIHYVNNGVPTQQPITLNFSYLTQYNATFTGWAEYQDGYTKGDLRSITIDQNGVILGVYSNGITDNLARVALAVFQNPAGLLAKGGNLFQVSNNSGDPKVGAPSEEAMGAILPGSLEMSNVDLSEEFTDMIVTQRGFQANSRIITTSDEMLQELVNLKR